MSVMWFALLFHNKLLKMGKKSLVLSDTLWTYFCFYLHCPVLVPTKSTERMCRSKPPLQKNGEKFSNLNGHQTCATWKKWNTWRKGGEIFHNVLWEIFSEFWPPDSGTWFSRAELQHNYTEIQEVLTQDKYKEKVHQMFHIQLHLPLKGKRFDHSVTTHSYWLKYIMFWDLDTWSPEINSEAAVKRRYEQRSVCSYFTKARSLRDVTCFSFFWTHKKES